jgi:cytokinin dehydrogenase
MTAHNSWTQALLDELKAVTGVPINATQEACESASQDFGGIVHGAADGVALPGDTDDLQRVVRFASERNLKLTVRGGGLSQSGQSIPRRGLSLDVRRLDTLARGVTREGTAFIHCGPGTTWQQLVDFAGPALLPRVMPLNPGLTIGGTLAAGGIGSTSHRYGPAVGQVQALDVIVGSGELVHCSPTQRPEVFRAALGGGGRAGVIARAEVPLRPVPTAVRTYYLLYDSFDVFLADQELIVTSDRADHLEGFASGAVQGMRKGPSGRRAPFAQWFFGLHISIEHAHGRVPDDASVLEGLRPTKVLHIEDDTPLTFAARYSGRFDAMRLTDAWSQAHPWLEVIVPVALANTLIPRALELLPVFLGDGHRITRIAAPALDTSMVYPERTPCVTFAVLPMGVHPRLLPIALGALQAVHDMFITAGAKRYVSGWLPDDFSWREHYGSLYEQVVASRLTVDPTGVFSA